MALASNSSDNMFFWFFPSTNVDAEGEIMIWLNGGVCPPLLAPAPRSSLNPADSIFPFSPDAPLSRVCFRRTALSCGNPVPTSRFRTPGAGTA